MKKFLEELEKHPNVCMITVDNIERNNIRKQMIEKYKGFVGKRALLTCKSTKEKRVVTIVKLYRDCVLLSYNYYGPGYTGSCNTTVSYMSLYCEEDRLEVE